MRITISPLRWSWIGVAAASLLAAATLAGPNRGPDNVNFPKLQLSGNAHGKAAIHQLGGNLSRVADAYGMDPKELRRMLNDDETLTVDFSGRLHYTEPAAGPTLGALGAAPAGALAPLANTFLLHSRPSAKRIIYLDFNGHSLPGSSAWCQSYNGGLPIVAPAWSLDADPTTFNDQERTVIQNIWQRVAEDYAPFDVDVTTELTSEDQITRTDINDEYYGTRALISPISSYFGNYGGFAYVGAFDDIGDTYKPALIFPEMLANGESFIAEAISHEVGHNLGLNHDGQTTGCGTTGTDPCDYYSGQGRWAPIMGVGYYEPLVQWSKGEYALANNQQDDLATIATYIPLRADDHGDTTATATVLPGGAQLSVSGVITSRTDVDVFLFSVGAGPVAIQINPDGLSPNLDILAQLLDVNGNVIATSNPIGALNAGFSNSLPAGTYFISVRGTGEGNPLLTGYSSYGSIGQYTITGTVTAPGPQPPVAIATATPSVAAIGQLVNFSGTGSYDPDGGSIVSYSWTFSDSTTASGATVLKSFSNPGTYTATLTVTDLSSMTGSTTISLRVNNPPVAGIAVSPGTSGTAPFAVSFSGASSTDSDGTISTYTWNFGDGTTGTGVNISKTYTLAGNYNVVLMVTDNNGGSGTASVTISAAANVPPVAAISVSPGTTGSTPFAVSFSGAGSMDSDGTISSYAWNFGNGTTGTGLNVSTTYNTAGTYNVVLTVTDNNGATGTASVLITVTVNVAPVAAISVSPGTSGAAPFAVSFSGAGSTDADGTIISTSYAWNFGDGTTGTGVSVSKTYSTAGSYNARLTVTDNNGATGTKTVTIVVAPNPATVLRVKTITMSVQRAGGGQTVTSRVVVTDLNGLVVSGVNVKGNWSGIFGGPDSANTDATGTATIISSSTKKHGSETFTVTGLTRPGYTYDATKNLVTSWTIIVP